MKEILIPLCIAIYGIGFFQIVYNWENIVNCKTNFCQTTTGCFWCEKELTRETTFDHKPEKLNDLIERRITHEKTQKTPVIEYELVELCSSCVTYNDYLCFLVQVYQDDELYAISQILFWTTIEKAKDSLGDTTIGDRFVLKSIPDYSDSLFLVHKDESKSFGEYPHGITVQKIF